MVVQAQNLVQYYEGPMSIGTSLPINEFTFIDNSHVAVKIRGENTNWVYGTDYTVSGATTSIRNLTLLKAVPSGKVLAAYVEIPITQGLAPEEGGNFPAATQELSLDKLTYICQMLYSRIKRSVQVSIDSNFDGLLYDSASQIGKAIILNETGTGLTYSTDKINDIMTFVKSLFSQMETLNTNATTSASNAASSASAASTSATNAANSATAAQTAANRIDGSVVTNLDTVAANGFYSCASTATGAPSASYSWIVLHETDGTNRYQYAVATNSTIIVYERIYTAGAWGPWTLRASSDVTLQGNTFNGANQLVQLDSSGKYPALDGSLITGITTAPEIPQTACSTAAATAAKTATLSGITIEDDVHFYVKFTNANTSATITLNINSEGDWDIYDLKGNQITGTYFSNADGETVLLKADKTNTRFVLVTAPFWESKMAMPSNVYVDLTLGVSGNNYTAAADGYVFIGKASSATGQNVNLYIPTNVTQASICWSTAGGQSLNAAIMVKKGDTFKCDYSAGGATIQFRFVYAEGSKP